ncbi:MAG TPA: glucuronate isomerase [Polyangiaceae bacterium]|nr:glucuronate isomerase [Polyangiaceae bacterium]
MTAPGVFDDDFLLETELARRLYHGYAEREPVIDYHSHLSPRELATDHRFRSLTELWLDNDHYKWRAMRTNGIAERFCTGDATDFEKFEAWAQTVPKTLRNPLFHVTHLELKRTFGKRRYLDPGSAREIFDTANQALTTPGYGARGLLERSRVAVVCTTDDPADSLEHHVAHARSPAAETLRLYPTFRADAALRVEHPVPFRAWLERLGAAVGASVRTYDQLLAALEARHAYFHQTGCRLSDHGLERAHADDYSLTDARFAFERASHGTPVTGEEAARYKSAVLHELALLDARRGWVQQLHLGAQRDNNTRAFGALGPATGFDSIGDLEQARPLARFLDNLDRKDQLARTILYNLNPRDNEVFATLLGTFQGGAIPGKLQLGPASWFLAHLDGMRRHLDALSAHGLLARFVGMVSDARSFLSYSRHEYFRRLLCAILASDADRGLLPHDEPLLGDLVRDLSFRNARDYFRFELPASARGA